MAPFTASDGIHDTATTLDSIFIAPLLLRVGPIIRPLQRRPKGSAWHHGGGAGPPPARMAAPSPRSVRCDWMDDMPDGVITVVLADDNLLVRSGVRALL